MKNASLFLIFLIYAACGTDDTISPVDPKLLKGPFELIADKNSICPSEIIELKLISYADPGQGYEIPISMVSFYSIPKEFGSIDTNGIYTAPSIIPSTRVFTLRGRLKFNPNAKVSIDLELIPENEFGGISVYNFPSITPMGIGSQGPIKDFNHLGEYLTGPPYNSGPAKDIGFRAYLYDSLRKFKRSFEGYGLSTDFVKFFDQRIILNGVSYIDGAKSFLFESDGQLIKEFKIPNNFFPLGLKRSPDNNWYFLTKNDRYEPSTYQLFAVDQEMNFKLLFGLYEGKYGTLPEFFPLSNNQFLIDFQKRESAGKRIKLIGEFGREIWDNDYGFYGTAQKVLANELPNGKLVLVTSEISQENKQLRNIYRELDRGSGQELNRIIFLEENSMEYNLSMGQKLYASISHSLTTKLGIVWVIGKFTLGKSTGFYLWNSSGNYREVIIPDVDEKYWQVFTSRFEEWGGGIRLTLITLNKKIDYLFGPNMEINQCNVAIDP